MNKCKGYEQTNFDFNRQPTTGGNSDLMADAFAKGASEAGNSVVQFNTAHKHIQGCRACDNCFSKENKACILMMIQ